VAGIDQPPTDWGEDIWTDGCGPVQHAMWGHYQQPFEDMKQAVEDAREQESEEMAEHGDSDSDVEIPDEYKLGNPGEAVEKAKYLGIGEGKSLAGDEMIHSMETDGETVFMPAPSHQALIDALREEGELSELSKPSKPSKLSEHGDADVRIPMPSESVQLLYPEQSIAADAAEAMGLNGTHEHDYEGEVWYMPGETHRISSRWLRGLMPDSRGMHPWRNSQNIKRLDRLISGAPARMSLTSRIFRTMITQDITSMKDQPNPSPHFR
jgi:hypothetical protein